MAAMSEATQPTSTTGADPLEAGRTALAEGGEKFMEFEATFFSKGFGSCIDRYGVNWMVDTEGEPDA